MPVSYYAELGIIGTHLPHVTLMRSIKQERILMPPYLYLLHILDTSRSLTLRFICTQHPIFWQPPGRCFLNISINLAIFRRRPTVNKSKQLMHYIQKFFQEYLTAHRGLSSNTVLAYRDAIKLFLAFLSRQKRSYITDLSLDDLSAENALAFLSDVEKTRQCSVSTRNLRLSACVPFSDTS